MPGRAHASEVCLPTALPAPGASPFLKGAVEVVHHRGVHHGRQETCILDAMVRRIPSEVVAFRLRPGGWERASKAEKR